MDFEIVDEFQSQMVGISLKSNLKWAKAQSKSGKENQDIIYPQFFLFWFHLQTLNSVNMDRPEGWFKDAVIYQVHVKTYKAVSYTHLDVYKRQ